MAKILYVGTASSECEQLCYLLEQGGHHVEAASCGERAMLRVEEKKDYEAMVLHLCYLPGMDGAELCRWIEKSSPIKGVPKIAFTLPKKYYQGNVPSSNWEKESRSLEEAKQDAKQPCIWQNRAEISQF